MAAPPIVRLDRVSKDYREGDESRLVLRETSVAFAEGEIVAIRGRSGSGKSTLLNLIAGIDVPTAGDVWVAGTCLNRLSPAERTLFRRDHLGFVFQFFNLIPTLTVLENVQLPGGARAAIRPTRPPRGRARSSTRSASSGRERAFPDRLSGGEQQRVAVARALVRGPAAAPRRRADGQPRRRDRRVGDGPPRPRHARGAGRSLVLVTHSAQVAAAPTACSRSRTATSCPLAAAERRRPVRLA